MRMCFIFAVVDFQYYEELFIEECCEVFLTTDDTNGCLPDDASPPTASPTAGPPPTTTSDDVGAGMQALTIGTTGRQSTVSRRAIPSPFSTVDSNGFRYRKHRRFCRELAGLLHFFRIEIHASVLMVIACSSPFPFATKD